MKHKNLYIKTWFVLNLFQVHIIPHPHHKIRLNSPPRWTPPINNLQSYSPISESRSNTISWYEGYYGPVHQGMAPNRQVQYTGPIYRRMAPNQQLHYQYRLPKSGPKRIRRKKWFRKAEPQPNHKEYESFGAVSFDHSTGVNPGMARNDASNNPKRGKVWRTPSKNPFMADSNLT